MDSHRLAALRACLTLAALILALPGAAGAAERGAGSPQGSGAERPFPIADVMGAEQARWRIAATASREVKIGAQMVIQTQNSIHHCHNCGPNGTPMDHERCDYAIFVQFPHLAGAASYNVVVQDKHPRVNTIRNYTGPPFNDNAEGFMTPGGVHWFGGLTGGGGPAPCPSDPYQGGRFEILKAVAIFDGKARIVGTVRKADGAGVAGVLVRAKGTAGASATTDVSGAYSMKVRKGTYAVSAKGYCVVGGKGCQASRKVKVTSGPTQVDFGPRPRVKLSGRVVERSCDRLVCSAPVGLADVRVEARSPDGEDPALATTAADGAWSVEVPSGRWTVTAAHQGRPLAPSSRKVDAKKDVTDLDFESCRSAGAEPGAGCDPDGIEWSMPDRLSSEIARAEFNDGHDGLPDTAFIHPSSWRVNLWLTRDGAPLLSPCNPPRDDIRWRWVVKPRDKRAGVKGKVPSSCLTRAALTRLGDYDVTVVKERRTGGDWDEELKLGPFRITPDDIIIAGIGDSLASGEGNPPFFFPRCNRSDAAYQFQAAEYVERQDPHTSVTFLHTACSGSRIQHLWQHRFNGTRDSDPLPRGRRSKLDPQLEQIAGRLRRDSRREVDVDAALVGAGVNDIAFGPTLAFCLGIQSDAPRDCPDVRVKAVADGTGGVREFVEHERGETLERRLTGLVGQLGRRYDDFMDRIGRPLKKNGLGLERADRVLLSQYPNFTRDAAGVCDTSDGPYPFWRPRTWGMLGDSGERLNGAISAGGGRYSVVPIDQDVFYPRGYCAQDSLFVGASENLPFNRHGGFHPKRDAHTLISTPTGEMLCAALYGGDRECKGRFRG